MGYQWATRIGYHQVDPDRKLTLSGLINLFQDCGGFHGADSGYSNKQLADMELAWIIANWQIAVKDMPDLDAHVVVETFPYKTKYFMASRYYRLCSPEGYEYARANSLWILMNMKSYRPVKVTKEIWEAYGTFEDIFGDYDFGDRKVEPAQAGEELPSFEVAPYMIDTNSHVNNEQYIMLAQCCLDRNDTWDFFRCQYTKQAKLGDRLIPFRAAVDGGVQISLKDETGEPYFTGEWVKKA